MFWLCSLPVQNIKAATYTVTSLNDSTAGSLRLAIFQANDSAEDDIINFQEGLSGAINLVDGQLNITSNISIRGPGARLLSISGNNVSRIFFISGNGITVDISGITITNGYGAVSDGGGAISVRNGAILNLTNSTVKDSLAAFVGGGIFVHTARVNITNSTITNNKTVDCAGGGINNNIDGVLTIVNSTISGNTANGCNGGGGILNFGELVVINSTISQNKALPGPISSGGAGGISNLHFNLRPILLNTIVANNSAPVDSDVFGMFISEGNNLIGNVGSATGFTDGVNGDKVGTATNLMYSLLGPLQNNGGQTDTHALLAGSIAINSGNNCVLITCNTNYPANPLISDQRGTAYPRLIGTAVDIGAFEGGIMSNPVTISGRVLSSGGKGLQNAFVRLRDSAGQIRTVITNPFGYYRFTDVIAGATYTVEASAKRHSFLPITVPVERERDDLIFNAIEP
jgi:hypothetical protein